MQTHLCLTQQLTAVPTACRGLEGQASLQAPPPWTLRPPSASLSSSLGGSGEGGEVWAATCLEGPGAGVLAPTSGELLSYAGSMLQGAGDV